MTSNIIHLFSTFPSDNFNRLGGGGMWCFALLSTNFLAYFPARIFLARLYWL